MIELALRFANTTAGRAVIALAALAVAFNAGRGVGFYQGKASQERAQMEADRKAGEGISKGVRDGRERAEEILRDGDSDAVDDGLRELSGE